MDLTDFKPKVDHFQEIHALGPDNVVPGAPNFRQVIRTYVGSILYLKKAV